MIATLLLLLILNVIQNTITIASASRINACPIRALVGIFSSKFDIDQRQNWRKLVPTIQNKEIVDSNYSHNLSFVMPCGISFIFVLGEHVIDGDELNARKKYFEGHLLSDDIAAGDTIVLPVQETIYESKTIAFFKYVKDHYFQQKIDYVLKMNIDTQICPSRILRYLQFAKVNASGYVGVGVDCFDITSDQNCHQPFDYFSSGLYGFSWQLLSLIVNRYHEFSPSLVLDENIVAGNWVQKVDPMRSFGRFEFTAWPIRYHARIAGHLPALARLNAGDIASSYLLPGCPDNSVAERKTPWIVWAFWFGDLDMGSLARRTAFKSLYSNIGVQVELITEDTIAWYNISSSPMHKVVDFHLANQSLLSKNHLVDYLRAYFMHHYGGGYHDIKARLKINPWSNEYFSAFEKYSELWMYGINEWCGDGCVACDESYTSVLAIPTCEQYFKQEEKEAVKPTNIKQPGRSDMCCRLVINSWKNLATNGAYIMRPNTSFTYEWLSNVERRLDLKFESLLKYPSPYDRCCHLDIDTQYPFRWAELHGEVTHPLQFKYMNHIALGLPPWDYTASYIDGGHHSIREVILKVNVNLSTMKSPQLLEINASQDVLHEVDIFCAKYDVTDSYEVLDIKKDLLDILKRDYSLPIHLHWNLSNSIVVNETLPASQSLHDFEKDLFAKLPESPTDEYLKRVGVIVDLAWKALSDTIKVYYDLQLLNYAKATAEDEHTVFAIMSSFNSLSEGSDFHSTMLGLINGLSVHALTKIVDNEVLAIENGNSIIQSQQGYSAILGRELILHHTFENGLPAYWKVQIVNTPHLHAIAESEEPALEDMTMHPDKSNFVAIKSLPEPIQFSNKILSPLFSKKYSVDGIFDRTRIPYAVVERILKGTSKVRFNDDIKRAADYLVDSMLLTPCLAVVVDMQYLRQQRHNTNSSEASQFVLWKMKYEYEIIKMIEKHDIRSLHLTGENPGDSALLIEVFSPFLEFLNRTRQIDTVITAQKLKSNTSNLQLMAVDLLVLSKATFVVGDSRQSRLLTLAYWLGRLRPIIYTI